MQRKTICQRPGKGDPFITLCLVSVEQDKREKVVTGHPQPHNVVQGNKYFVKINYFLDTANLYCRWVH